MELPEGLDFARSTRWSVLTTIRKNGRPQLSNVGHVIDEAGVIRISITADRAKYKNILRESWVALHVTREDFYAYAVLEGDVELSPVATHPDAQLPDAQFPDVQLPDAQLPDVQHPDVQHPDLPAQGHRPLARQAQPPM